VRLDCALDKQWQLYREQMDKLGRAIESTGRAYEELQTTRANTLQKPLDKIEDLRQSRALPDE
jgi:DNA anti-recombination protein RmuC